MNSVTDNLFGFILFSWAIAHSTTTTCRFNHHANNMKETGNTIIDREQMKFTSFTSVFFWKIISMTSHNEEDKKEGETPQSFIK